MRVLCGLVLIAGFALLAASALAGGPAGASAVAGGPVGASELPCGAAGAFLRSQSAAARRDGTVVIRGRVATHPHATLSGAEVSISASTFRTLTTDGGTYRLSIPGVLLTATQARRVTAARTGYDPQVLPLELSPGDSIVVDFVLCPAGSEDGPRAPSLHSPPVASAVTRATGRSMSGALTGVGRRMRGAGEAVASRGPFRTGQERPGPG